MDIQAKLYEYKDLEYKEFTSKLIPNINKDNIIGVRTPIIRKLSKEIAKYPSIDKFLNELPHTYHEENILHGMILGIKYKNIDEYLNKLNEFLNYVDSWAVCDTINPKIFKKYPSLIYKEIKKWLKSDKPYIIRFGVVTLLQFYLDENFQEEELELVSKIKNDDYYVKMGIAWFYSYALIKQYDKTIQLFLDKKLDKWIHNKSITKACESYRVSNLQKEYLKSLRIK